ncbi:MAG: phage major capsid protein [Shewanella sp.]|nr:phage major capsid protein [Shewanella sp.]
MAKSNSTLSRRADMRLGELANGGLLNPEQADKMIDYIQDEPTILQQVRVERMRNPQKNIDRTGFKGRILHTARQDPAGDGSENRALQIGERKHMVNSQIQLNTTEFIAEVRIPYEVLEDNIERGNFEMHTVREMSRQIAQDLEELALNGDTASGDSFLASKDGFLKQMSGNVIDNANIGVSPDLFDQGLLAMPQKYLRNLNALRHYISTKNAIKYRAEVAKRATGYGDSALTQNIPLYAGGVQIEAAPMLTAASESAWGVNDGTSKESGFFTFPKNLIWGIQRNITMEQEKLISEREVKFVVTLRCDFLIDDPDACVKYVNIG